MNCKNVILLLFLLITIPVFADIKCDDLKYENTKYHENMEELAKQAHLQDDYYSRHHEDAVRYFCAGDTEGIKKLVAEGFVQSSEIEAIKNVLGKDHGLEKSQSSGYLPWTLDVSGYGSGKCQVTELAKSFKEARGWASEESGYITVHSIVESNEKIIIAYYDGLLKAESIRTFYRDMETCQSFR